MGRQQRSGLQTGWHHVTNRGIDRQLVFRSDADRIDFGRLLATGHAEYDVAVLAYCLMGNHFHLVLDCPDGNLSPFMQQLSAKFTRHVNERRGGDGAIFRGRFFSRPVVSPEYLVNAVRYVHRNPLDLRPRVDLAAYRWSSHRTYLGLRPCPEWLRPATVLGWFSSPAQFDRLVRDDPPAERLDVSVAQLTHAVDHVVDEMSAGLHRAPQGIARTVRYLLLDRVAEATRSELIESMGLASEDSVKQAIWRANRLANSDAVYHEVAGRAWALAAITFKLCLTQLESQSQAGRVAS